jgi:hypothetical protein
MTMRLGYYERRLALLDDLRAASTNMKAQINALNLSSAQAQPAYEMLVLIVMLIADTKMLSMVPSRDDRRTLNALVLAAQDVIDAADAYMVALFAGRNTSSVPPDPTANSFLRAGWWPKNQGASTPIYVQWGDWINAGGQFPRVANHHRTPTAQAETSVQAAMRVVAAAVVVAAVDKIRTQTPQTNQKQIQGTRVHQT